MKISGLLLLGPATCPAFVLVCFVLGPSPALCSVAGLSSASHTDTFNIINIFSTAPLAHTSMRDANWFCDDVDEKNKITNNYK